MNQVADQIKKERIVSIIRTSTLAKAKLAIDACFEAGFKILEITFTIPDVEKAIQYAFQKYQNQLLIGAGTVLTLEQAKKAQALGCQFIVAPNTNQQINDFCHQEKILYIPGVMTVNEIVRAMEMNNQIVKLFPANAFSIKYISAIKTPLPNVQIMATGGINEENIAEWLNSGADVCGIGGNLIAPIEKNDDYLKTVELGKKYLTKVLK